MCSAQGIASPSCNGTPRPTRVAMRAMRKGDCAIYSPRLLALLFCFARLPLAVGDAQYDCIGQCPGSWPYGCAGSISGKEKLRCSSGGGCQYLNAGEVGNVAWCIYRDYSAADPGTSSTSAPAAAPQTGSTLAPATSPTPPTAAPTCKLPASVPVPSGVLRPPRDPSIALVDVPGTGGGYNEGHEAPYLGSFQSLTSDSYSELDSPSAPSSLAAACANKGVAVSALSTLPERVLSADGAVINTAAAAAQCAGDVVACVVPNGMTLRMDASLDLTALIVRGALLWDETTQRAPEQWLCAGFIAIEGAAASFQLNLR